MPSDTSTPYACPIHGERERLNEAAPDLLAALKLYVEHFGDPLKIARAAIAKAEHGEQETRA